MPSRPPTHSQLMRAKHPERYRPTYDDHRGTAAERGYDGAWVKFRKYIASIRPAVCVVCGVAFESKLMHLDHIKPIADGGERLDPANVQWMCRDDHSRKTATTDGGFGHKK